MNDQTKLDNETALSGDTKVPQLPSLAEATRVWLRIGCLSFGGPAGQIALMHREVVDERHWISDRRFLHALNFCSLLPGPEAQQLATYLGWLLHGAKGGLIAGLLFIIPGALVMFVLSAIFVIAGDVPVVAALFFGLKCAVLVIVFEALLKVARRALKGGLPWLLAAAAFGALFLFSVPFPAVVLSAALVGALAPGVFSGGAQGEVKSGSPALLDAVMAADPDYAKGLAKSARRAGILSLAAWVAPVLALLPFAGVYADVAWFFSKMAVVTFGGAYAVLTYVAQEAVEGYAWLSAAEMLTGLGLAETTPGPLILVLQFVGFLAGYGQEAGLAGAVIAALITLWVTFAPCFAFVFLGAPAIERLQEKRALAGALAAITAAVVGVIANLALWFGLRVVFSEMQAVGWGAVSLDLPVLQSIHPAAVIIVLLAAVALFRFKLGVLKTLSLCSLAGLLLKVGLGL
ncbi:chromate efflux transporter [Denitrobaculum tricleocarpae]|uniref:Chromate efflux transporter n=1 Tax=Denitrobaculum tricleocarpae TaxID=2591009 RepID=A0A545TKY4_9PROT|nr:chromate efflux transporter [Denitrobaculum tricleocarpae]TQV77884.1 chromate efflux transporter [Denitrobaculum tricleocarpae]